MQENETELPAPWEQVGPAAWLSAPLPGVAHPGPPLWAASRPTPHMTGVSGCMRCSQAHTALGGGGEEGMRKQEAEVQNPPLEGREEKHVAAGCGLGIQPLLPSVSVPISRFPGQPAVPGRLKRQARAAPPHVLTATPHPRHTHTHARQLGMSWLPGLPMEVDWECRLWEETTIFIVWIKYFSWLSCCLLSHLFFPYPILSHSCPLSSLHSPPLPRFLPQSQVHTEKFPGERLLEWEELF